jgi:hypothetical protein
MATTPPNNALKLTSFALQGGLTSQLNAVLAGPRIAMTRHGDPTCARVASRPYALALDAPVHHYLKAQTSSS